MEHRDTPELEAEQAGEVRTLASRRFAKLVESPVARRVALPRILLAAAILLSLIVLVIWGGSKFLVHWVATQPDYQLRFSEIDLIPEPPPWVRCGKSGILEQIRNEANHDEKLSLLNLDLEVLEKDFRRCWWVKGVTLVERSYGSLAVHLIYRKPVAVVVRRESTRVAYPIDADAVFLRPVDIDWIAEDPPFQVRGIADPLIEIRRVQHSRPPKPGVPWKRSGSAGSLEEDDPMVLKAARLAGFLQRQKRSTASGSVLANFVSIIIPDEPNGPYFLQDAEQNLVNWGEAPGDERQGESSSETRWKMLLARVDRHGPLNAKYPNYLSFTRTEAVLIEPRVPKR
jgi:hypothetical protein